MGVADGKWPCTHTQFGNSRVWFHHLAVREENDAAGSFRLACKVT